MTLRFYSPAARPGDEQERQRVVDASGIVRAPPDPTLHEIVVACARLFEAPMAAVTIVDRDRQWFAARVGLNAPETSRAVSFCAHAILVPDDMLLVRDATQDVRFAGNPLVLFDPGIRFYVGVPITGAAGHAIGALCVIDRQPRTDALPLAELATLAERARRAIADIAARFHR